MGTAAVDERREAASQMQRHYLDSFLVSKFLSYLYDKWFVDWGSVS